ncbi:MAG: YaaA family protein [Parafannyhessea sp.]|uniref:YaaA family protein n=1 Tax=Parafannyhessea sp. TaxID=2847324 RepID=UPI003F04230D
MFILSPAKRMVAVEGEPRPRGVPALLDRTRVLQEALRGLTLEQSQALWRCSDALAQQSYGLHQRMDLDAIATAGSAACASFNGIAFTHLAAQVMSERQLDYLQAHLRIVSAFYGCLRPLDAILPYRLEMAQRLAVPAVPVLGLPATSDLYAWWGDSIACEVLRGGPTALVNVASVEYARAVVPHAGQVPVVTCLFGTRRASDGRFVQRATEAKAARGSFVRWCAEGDVDDVAGLRTYAERGYALDESISDGRTLRFVRRA